MNLAGNAATMGGKWNPNRAAEVAQAWKHCCDLDRAALRLDTAEAYREAAEAWRAFNRATVKPSA